MTPDLHSLSNLCVYATVLELILMLRVKRMLLEPPHGQ